MSTDFDNDAYPAPAFKSIGVQVNFTLLGYWCEMEAHTFGPPSRKLTLSNHHVMLDLGVALALIIRDAKSLHVTFDYINGAKPWLYVDGDGEDPHVYLPDDWRAQLTKAARSIGFVSAYDDIGSEVGKHG